MTESKHTPGPWVSERSVTGVPPDAGCGIVASDDDVKISNPSRGIVAWATRLVSRTNQETIANARLIAAAPDMLAALELMVMWMPSGFAPVAQDKAMTAAYNAIRKATGETP